MKKLLQFSLIFTLAFASMPHLFAQCPAGQISVSIEINAPSFGTEISWELVNNTTGAVEASADCGTYATGDVVLEGPFCISDSDGYTLIGYDTFGDDWNGGFFNLIISEDGSVNGCTGQTGCVIVQNGGQDLDTEPDVASTNTCVAGTNEEFAVAFPALGCPIMITGCDDPAALNFNACVNAPDNATCIFPSEADLCTDPLPICGTTPVFSSNIGATSDANDPLPSCVGSLENTVWFVFESDASGTPIDITITEGADCGGGFNLQTSIYSGIDCGGGGVEEACDAGGPIYLLNLAAPTPNTTYYVYIDGNGGTECSFTLQGSGGIAECCGAEFTLTPKCQAGDEDNFYVDIDVTDLGTDTEYTVTGGTNITATGTQTLGPFPNGTATITVDAVNTDCTVENIVENDCSCDPLAVTASEDQGPFCPDTAPPFEINASLDTVIAGGFLGTYTVTADAAGTCTATSTGPPTTETLGDDEFAGPIALPFNFEFFENTYADFYISSNGYITFGAGSTNLGNAPIPDGFDPNNFIALFWDDLDPGDSPTGQIIHFPSDYNGLSCYSVFFANIENFPGGGTEPTITGQMTICEDGTIVINCVNCQSDGGDATQGIENADGTVGYFDPLFADGTTTDTIMNCVTFTRDVAEPAPCDFVGWVTDLNDIAGTTVSIDTTTTVTPATTTTYYAVVDCEGILCVDDVIISLDPTLCDNPLDPPNISIADPCACGNAGNIMTVAGADPTDAMQLVNYFIEVVTINVPAAATAVTITETANTGILDMAGAASTTAFTNTGDSDGDGFDEWQATFYHAPGAGYTLSVDVDVDGVVTPLSIDNTCEQCMLPMPTIAITDPCNCGDSDNIPLNAGDDTSIFDTPVLFFAEEVTIDIPSGAAPSFNLSATSTGILDMNGMTIIPNFVNTGDTDGDGFDEWVASFYHAVNIGYNLDVDVTVNGVVTPLSTTNTCTQCEPMPEVPTLGEWGLIMLALMMSIVAIIGIRQRSLTMAKVRA